MAQGGLQQGRNRETGANNIGGNPPKWGLGAACGPSTPSLYTPQLRRFWFDVRGRGSRAARWRALQRLPNGGKTWRKLLVSTLARRIPVSRSWKVPPLR